MRRALRSSTITLLPLLVVAALTACRGGDGELQDIASLGTTADDESTDTTDTSDTSDTTDATDTTDADGASDSDGGPSGDSATGTGMVVMQSNANSDDPEVQDAQVRYSRCMREHGIDMPDPGADGQTRIEIDDPDAWEEAEEECRPIIEEVVGTFEPPSEEEQARMREEALEFSKCMRDHGIDMPDPQFGENGEISISGGGEAAPGDPTPDDDDDFQAAAEECGGPGDGMIFSSDEPVSD